MTAPALDSPRAWSIAAVGALLIAGGLVLTSRVEWVVQSSASSASAR